MKDRKAGRNVRIRVTLKVSCGRLMQIKRKLLNQSDWQVGLWLLSPFAITGDKNSSRACKPVLLHVIQATVYRVGCHTLPLARPVNHLMSRQWVTEGGKQRMTNTQSKVTREDESIWRIQKNRCAWCHAVVSQNTLLYFFAASVFFCFNEFFKPNRKQASA